MIRRGILVGAAACLLIFPVLTRAGSSNSLLDVSPDGKQLLAANNDNDSVTVVDLTTEKKVREIRVGKKPEAVSWIGNGPRAAVTCFKSDEVVIFDTSNGKIIRSIKVDVEPYGIVVDKAGKTAWVTHDYPGVVSEINLTSYKVVRRFRIKNVGEAHVYDGLPGSNLLALSGKNSDDGSYVRWLRGIGLSSDEKRIYVTEFYTARLYAIDVASGKLVDTWKGHSTDNLCRHVLLHPRRPKAYLSHVRSKIKVISGEGSIFPIVTCYDLRPKEKVKDRRNAIGMDVYNGVYVVTNAWEAAMSPDGKRIYTIYAGTNDMNLSRVVDDDYREFEPMGRARMVGKNPRAVRVSPDGKKVYIYNTLDFSVGVYDGYTMRRLGAITVCDPPKSPEWVRGKVLFNSARFPMTRRRWVSCSSCHPDGNHDGRTWFNPEGTRKTTAFFGMAHTHPLHWSGDRDEVQDFEYTIRSPLMIGTGLYRGSILRKHGFEKIELKQKLSGVSKDLDALAIYCNSFEFPLSPHIPAPGKLYPEAERGKKIFFSKTTGCATCHNGPFFSDSSLKKPYNMHDVGTNVDDPRERMGSKYDTPTLLGVYRQRMFLHHGRALTLHDVLTKQNPKNQHGKTSHLTAEQRNDLVAYLKSLPYEPTPHMTANTVPHRFVEKKKKK